MPPKELNLATEEVDDIKKKSLDILTKDNTELGGRGKNIEDTEQRKRPKDCVTGNPCCLAGAIRQTE